MRRRKHLNCVEMKTNESMRRKRQKQRERDEKERRDEERQ